MFDPRDCLVVARAARLLAQVEAADRVAIGRASYAAFLVTRQCIERRRIVAHPPAGHRWGPHESVILAVGEIRAAGARGRQRRVFRQKTLRTLADYDLARAEAHRDGERAIDDAERVIAWIDRLP